MTQKNTPTNNIVDTQYKFTFSDLFSGIGGFHIALSNLKGQCLYAVEWDQFARHTYYENFKNENPSLFESNAFYKDITAFENNSTYTKLPKVNVLCAGFPCQPFSTIGKREGFNHRTQGTLFFNILQILKQRKRPDSFILENVAGLTNHKSGKTLEIILDELNKANYTVYYKILDSSQFGVPQHRKRIYIVGFKKYFRINNFIFPEGSDHETGVGQFITNIRSNKYDISKHLQKSYIFKKDDGRPQIVTNKSDFPIKTLVASYHKIQRLTGTFVKGGTTGLRLLSINECKAIMGFPGNYKFPVSRTQAYRQLGNSVAIPVVEAIAKKVKSQLSKKGII